MEEKQFLNIIVETKKGKLINITDLSKNEYEHFLETMHQLRIAYINMIDSKKGE